MGRNIIDRLKEMPARPGTFSPSMLRSDADLSAATTADREQIAEYKVPAPINVRGEQRFQVTVPAFEQFTTNGTAADTETFSLSNSVMETPNTENIVVWEGGTYVGSEAALDAVDYAANTFDYTDDGTNNTLHVWYVSDESATLEVEKVSASQNQQQGLYEEQLNLVHQTNQSEQPETPDVGKTPLNRTMAADMTFEVYLEAPYTFRWEDPDGDGATPSNLLFSFPVNRAQGQLDGLSDVVSTDMSQE